MSELKVYKFLGIDEVYPDANLGGEYYLKSEVDKVIAEKDKEIRHQKYKRCLKMATLCASRHLVWLEDPTDGVLHKSDFYARWKLRWRKLAEKFKPNNQTAQ